MKKYYPYYFGEVISMQSCPAVLGFAHRSYVVVEHRRTTIMAKNA